MQWGQVLFTDESRFHLSHSDGRIRVYRRRGERYVNHCVMEEDRFGGGSVMVWGGITARQRTRLIVVEGNLNGQRYRDGPVVLPSLRRHDQGITFQHDNVRPHIARLVQDSLQQNNVNVLPLAGSLP